MVDNLMSVALTRISPNGQVVIPADVRKAARISSHDQFIVFERDGTILLKKVRPQLFEKDLAILARIAEAEDDIRKGRSLTLPSDLSAAEMLRRIGVYVRRDKLEGSKTNRKTSRRL